MKLARTSRKSCGFLHLWSIQDSASRLPSLNRCGIQRLRQKNILWICLIYQRVRANIGLAGGSLRPAGMGGTCASMPVMYVAIGRRLGYPLKLVTTNGHIFVRWDGEDHPNPAWRERFNIEGAGDGFSSYDDEHYKNWPFKLTEVQVRANRYLVSLTPAEEFAEFLAARGHCGLDNGQIAFAARCYENAYRYDTTRPAYRAWFLDAARKSGYRPATPALAQAIAERMNQVVAARRESFDPMATPRPSDIAALGVPGLPQIPQPSVPQIPQPGLVQPYQPPAPGQPPSP